MLRSSYCFRSPSMVHWSFAVRFQPVKNSSFLCSTSTLARSLATKAGSKSHVGTKLGHYLRTGEILNKSDKQYESRGRKKVQRFQARPLDLNYSKQKMLLLIQLNYEGKLADAKGQPIGTRNIKVADLASPYSEKSKHLFYALVQVAKISKKPVSKRLMMLLLGVQMASLTDEYIITREILKLLEHDGDTVRAEWLARAASKSLTVGMNEIMKFLLEKGDSKAAMKNFNDRKKWGIAFNNQTYVILFDGLARSHAFGGVSDALVTQTVAIFETFMNKTLVKKSSNSAKRYDEEHDYTNQEVTGKEDTKCGIEHFNACLNLVMRNFTNDQAAAWEFFDILVPKQTGPDDPKLQPLFANNQTYTTLLNGIRRYCQSRADAIINDRQMSKDVKTLKLLEVDAKLVSTFEMILSKVLSDAMPPVPPTRERADQDPELLLEYRRLIRRPRIEIDSAFVGTFVLCYINGSSGNPHYSYVARGLEYLRLWCKEIEPMTLKTLGQGTVGPSEKVVADTDIKLQSALKCYQADPSKVDFEFITEDGLVNDILPENVIVEKLNESKVNPKVIFPPPLLSNNKSRATFSGKAKPLVDISRASDRVLRALIDNKKFKKSKGKFGKKISLSMDTRLKYEPINRFIYGLYLDGLLKQGLFNQFYLSVWYGLSKWGGIHVELDKMIAASSAQTSTGANKGGVYVTPSLEAQDVLNRTTNTPPHIPEIIDELMLDNFLYKLSENCPGDISPSRICVELISALNNPDTNISYTLVPRYKSIDVIFSILTKELYHVKDSNYNFNRRVNSGATNIAKKSLTKLQLNGFTKTLVTLMDSLAVKMESEQRTRAKPNTDLVVQKQFVESYVRFVDRLGKFVWPADEDCVAANHLRLVRSGVSMYMPKNLMDKRKELVAHSNEAIDASFGYLAKKFSAKEGDLTPNEMQLMKWIKILGKKFDGDEMKLRAILLKVREYCDSILRGEKDIRKGSKFVDADAKQESEERNDIVVGKATENEVEQDLKSSC